MHRPNPTQRNQVNKTKRKILNSIPKIFSFIFIHIAYNTPQLESALKINFGLKVRILLFIKG